jgi:hypothetical protein
MMTGRLYIDGYDAYDMWGVYVTKDGWNELIAFPPLKTIDTNDWQEDGVEPDLESPALDAHEVQLKLAVSGGLFTGFFDLVDLLSDGAYHEFNGVSIGRTYRLRLVSTPNYKDVRNLEVVTLKMADDFPLRGYTYEAPANSCIPSSEEYDIDGIWLSDYGIRVLSGTLDEIKKNAEIKKNLLRNIGTASGAYYDGEMVYETDESGNKILVDKNVRYKTKEVKLTCLMRANNLEELWRNWDALLYNLVRPDERNLYCRELEETFPFYYKSCTVSEFYPTDKIWLKFTVTVVFFKDFRISSDVILCTEDGTPIYTEDDTNAIDMKPIK